LYRARVRQAVREVEEVLVNLQSTAARSNDTQLAAEGYRAAFKATQARYDSGLASLPELEEARRTALGADIAVLSLERERQLAWVALYRAAGGGWQMPPARATASAPPP
jgi:outer membrane protein TolC